MLEANYLPILLKPSYEKAIDTAQDVIDRNLKILLFPGLESRVEIMKNSPSNITRTLAERTIVAKVIFIDLLKNIILILNFPERIGTKMSNWLKTQLLMALLYLKFPICGIIS